MKILDLQTSKTLETKHINDIELTIYTAENVPNLENLENESDWFGLSGASLRSIIEEHKQNVYKLIDEFKNGQYEDDYGDYEEI